MQAKVGPFVHVAEGQAAQINLLAGKEGHNFLGVLAFFSVDFNRSPAGKTGFSRCAQQVLRAAFQTGLAGHLDKSGPDGDIPVQGFTQTTGQF